MGQRLGRKILVWAFVLGTAATGQAATHRVTSISGLQSAIGGAAAGDTIVVANGSYTTSGSISVTRAGTASARLTIAAETIGGVTISGSAGFAVSSPAAYVTIRGFRFMHSGTMTLGSGTHHCLVTRNLYGSGGTKYLSVEGDDHEISYNTFQNKSHESPFVGLGDDPVTHRIYVHHNYFRNHSSTAANHGESLQVFANLPRVEYNLFEACNGDPEVISIKEGGASAGGTYRYNTFRDITRGHLTVRFSRRDVIEGNFFINAPGIRAYGSEHKIRNNYFGGKGQLILGDGATDGGYPAMRNVEVSFNTFVNAVITGQDRGAIGIAPENVTIANNIVVADTGTFVSEPHAFVNPKYEGNILWGNAAIGAIPPSGYRKVDPQLIADVSGTYHLASTSPAIDSAAGLYTLGEDIDGQPRSGALDVGADERSSLAVTRRPLTASDVGPNAGLTATPTPTPTPTATSGPTPTPTPTEMPGADVEVTPGAAAVTASTSDGNLPGNVVDDSLATRWSAIGDPVWLKLDLGESRIVTRVRIAVYNGNTRQNRFDLQVSSDNVTWTDVLTAASTSGTTTLEETHEIADQAARWVRYVGHGCSDPTKLTTNSVTEISVFALPLGSTPTPTPTPTATPTETPSPTPTPTATPSPSYVEITPTGAAVTASTNDGNLPGNAVDNNLATRWSANGDGQWLQLDLGTTRTVGHVKVAVYNGNSRRNRFDVQVSTGGGVWQTVWTGQSSGSTTAEETYDFTDVPARWVRYLGHMNDVNTFNSVSEVSVFAVP